MDRFSEIRCVCFDLDDTLWPCEPTILKAENALYEWLNLHYPNITNKYTSDDLQVMRTEFAERNPEISHNVTELRRQFLLELAEEFHYPENLATDGLILFRNIRNQVNFFHDTLETLEALKNKYKLGAITNGNADLNVIGIRNKFDFVVTAESAGVAKPHQEIFRRAEKIVNLESKNMLMVGDCPQVDIIAVKEIDWKAIWINRSNINWSESVEPDVIIDQLSELKNILGVNYARYGS